MNKLLTIIIPTYNMEKYLRRCLDSLIVDEEGMKLLEVLVVNDGSRDSSSAIAHEYQDKYPDTFRVIDKENGNYGSCINRGLKEATGKYVKVLDADDWFDNENFNSYIAYLSNVDLDMCITNYDIVSEAGRITKREKFHLPENQLLNIDGYCSTTEFGKIEMHAVTYRTQILKDISYHQNEGISYTDQEWMFEPMSYVKSFSFYEKVIYKYLVGRSGQTMSGEQRRRSMSHVVKGVFTMLDVYQNRKDACGKEMERYLKRKLVGRFGSVYNHGLMMGYLSNEELINIDNRLKQRSMYIYEMTNGLKIKIFAFYYVAYWRKHQRRPLPYIIINGYAMLRKIKNIVK